MKPGKFFLTTILLLLGYALVAQNTAAASATSATAPNDALPRIMAYILVSAAAVLFIVTMFYVVTVNQYLYKRVVSLEAAKSGVALEQQASLPAEPADSFWTRMRKEYWEDAVPMEREHEIMSHHDFDGIRELDNRLPPWWVNMFILTIIWAAVFMFYYHFGGGGPTQTEYYEMEMEKAKQQQVVALAGQANAVDEGSVSRLTDATAVGEGELIYKNVCAACHGQAGEGGVGPNMTDEYWLHGGGIKNIFKTIKYGVPEKGMIAWSSQLSASDMQKVASYIMTLEGSSPANPKAPQGEIWKESGESTPGTPATIDSTAVQNQTTGGEVGSL